MAGREPCDLDKQVGALPGDLPQLCRPGSHLGFSQAARGRADELRPSDERPAAGHGQVRDDHEPFRHDRTCIR